MEKKESQPTRILRYLQEHPGEWINGQSFLRTMMFSQFHHKIFRLQNERWRYIYDGTIEASDFRDEYGFKSYHLNRTWPAPAPQQSTAVINGTEVPIYKQVKVVVAEMPATVAQLL